MTSAGTGPSQSRLARRAGAAAGAMRVRAGRSRRSDRRSVARIDKSVLALSEPKRHRNKEHLRFVAQQPCLICARTPSDPHHLRFAQPRALGRKVSDEFVVPLCRSHHRALHRVGNEPGWWKAAGIDPLEVARKLWGQSRLIEPAEPVRPGSRTAAVRRPIRQEKRRRLCPALDAASEPAKAARRLWATVGCRDRHRCSAQCGKRRQALPHQRRRGRSPT